MTGGVAGRTDYGKWDRVTSSLVAEVEEQDEAERAKSSKELGHDRLPRSQAEADERQKAEEVRKAKAALDGYRAREAGVVQVLTNLLEGGDGGESSSEGAAAAAAAAGGSCSGGETKYVTRSLLDAGKRVLTLSDTTGPGTIVLTQDLSNLETAVPTNSNLKPKSYEGDAENDVVVEEEKQQQQQMRKIYGLVKLNLQNLQSCTVVIKCKVITGTVEIANCTDLVVKVIGPDATVVTVQADLCRNLDVEFHDAPSGRNVAMDHAAVVAGIGMGSGGAGGAAAATTKVFWGEDKDDRLFHAGVSNLRVATYRDGFVEHETKPRLDYKQLGAEAVGNASAEEVQFVTSVVGGELLTERVVKVGAGAGASAGSSARAMTEREVEEERKRKENSPCPENLIRFVEKEKKSGGDATKTSSSAASSPTSVADKSSSIDVEDEAVEDEVYASMTKEQIDAVVKDCEVHKAKGNEAFTAGEYAQAVLHYSLALDSAAELPDADRAEQIIAEAGKNASGSSPKKIGNNIEAPPVKQLFPRHVVLSNRSASFLKLGEHEKALKDATEATALDPTYVKAAFRSGLALHAMGRYQEAVPALGAAHRIEPKNKQIKQALQFAEIRLQQQIRMEG